MAPSRNSLSIFRWRRRATRLMLSLMNLQNALLPPHAEMVRAMLERDTAYEGVFFTAVKTTGIFCRPSCTARKPKPENVEFFAHADECMSAGYRACLRCKPLDAAAIAPDWVQRLLKSVDADPDQRWTDAQLLAEGIEPLKLRRWFKQHFGMTFHAWLRTRRLGMALGGIKQGDSIDNAAFDSGYESLSGFRDAFQKSFHITPGRAANSEPLLFTRLTTPLGPMIAMAERRGLVLLEFLDRPALTKEVEELQNRYGYAVAPGHNAHLQQIEAGTGAVFRRQTHRLQRSTAPAWQRFRPTGLGRTGEDPVRPDQHLRRHRGDIGQTRRQSRRGPGQRA